MMTEAEAKERWCPLARPIVPAIDKSLCTNGTLDMRCIGSACMAWRWEMLPMPYPKNDILKQTDRGFCGAFGKE